MAILSSFKIPKLTDREIVLSLNRVRIALKDSHSFKIRIHLPHGPAVMLPENEPDKAPDSQFAFDANSQVINLFELISQNKKRAFLVERQTIEALDVASITDDWIQQGDDSLRQQLPALHVKLLSLARSELKATDVEAALVALGDSEWNRYRQSQMAVMNSLQQAAETLLIKAAEQNAELDQKRTERFEKLEKSLREQIEAERITFKEETDKTRKELDAHEQDLAARQSSFETKESHYVARKKQSEQIEQINVWLDNWSLTKGTSKKRWPITAAYLIALAITGGLTLYATWHSYALLKSIDEIVKLAWWQWIAIWTKSVLPLAAFATFIIYFIRWSGDWARQHSEEEFRNRTRLIDIGRSAWLLEAVRDAQERKSEIPSDLLRELSRNLFATNSGADSDIHPQAISDMMMQGLSSLRVRSADGTEVEASRNKKS